VKERSDRGEIQCSKFLEKVRASHTNLARPHQSKVEWQLKSDVVEQKCQWFTHVYSPALTPEA